MKTKSRIVSILKAESLGFSITGLQTFYLSELELPTNLNFQLPTNLRLGHLAERVVSALISASTNYNILHENVQIVEDKRTIGEIDFIIQEKNTEQITHLELAYKFYLYDPTISSEPFENWIGPNRNDSLKKKIDKLKSKQFPLLYQKPTKQKFPALQIDKISQALCLLVSLYIPYEFQEKFNAEYSKAIKGYYLDFEKFLSFNHTAKSYYLPQKKEWGIDPSENDNWSDFNEIKEQISKCVKEKQASLCWQKHHNTYLSFFIVWW